MANAVIMPRQGQSVESCIITAWHKKPGDKVAKGDILFSYETDKSAFDEASETEGTLLKVLFNEGDDVPCLKTVCFIGAEGEDVSAFAGAPAAEAPKAEAAAPAAEASKAAAPAVTGTAPAADGERLKISPRARNLALKTDADLSKVAATGPNGRIIERDVVALLDKGLTAPAAKVEAFLAGDRSALAGAPAAEAPKTAVSAAPVSAPEAEYVDEKLPQIRRVIAKSMQQSLTEGAQLTLNASFDATQIMAFRASFKANGEAMGMPNITINDMILFAVAKTLGGHRALNAHYLGDSMRYFKNVNLGIAVDTERGLMVPTVNAAEKLTLSELARASKAVITEAQSGTISPDKLKGASFTVSNLGAMGIESFTPVINPPQTGILGVCSLTKRVKEGKDGTPVFYPCIPLSLTFDHRALDGAPAARFLKELCTNLENFNLLLAR